MIRAAILFAAVPAAAEVAPPASPPWACHLAAACDAGGCTMLPRLPAPFAIEPGAGSGTLRLNGTTVGHYPTRMAAEAALAAGALPPDAALVLVRDAHDPADAVGFSAYAPSSQGGVLSLSPTFASLVCTGT